jgi:EmrB/QacA subfamily drug resistance transporter
MTTNRYLVALVVALGLFPSLLDTSIVVVALTPIRNQLHTDTNTAQWVLTAYFLATASVVAAGGYLANHIGRKFMFLLGIGLFTMGSLLCALAPGIGWLIAFRVAQGVGAGIMLPVAPALAFDAFPTEQRARASAVVGIPIMLAPVFGPMAGGYLTDTFSWHSLFLVNVPLGLMALAAVKAVLPRDTRFRTREARFDYLGLALATVGVVAIVYAFKLVTQTDPATVTATNPVGDLYGWGARPVWALAGGGAVILVLFTLYALRISRDPALDVRQLGRRDFLVSNLLSWAMNASSFGVLVLVPLYLESVRVPHLSALQTGQALMPLGIGALVGTALATALYRAIGPRGVVLLGVVLMVVTAWLLAQTIQPTADAAQLLAAARAQTPIAPLAGAEDLRWRLLLFGVSFGLVGIPVQTLALEALTGAALAKASSLVLSTKLIFSSIGVAIMTTLLVDSTRARATALIQQLTTLEPRAAVSSHPALDPRFTAQLAAQAGAAAIQHIFWLIGISTCGLIVIAFFLPGRRRQARTQPLAAQPVAAREPAGAGR